MNEKSLQFLKSLHSLAMTDIEKNPSTINFWIYMMFIFGNMTGLSEFIDIMLTHEKR
jgi:hypothetical protein